MKMLRGWLLDEVEFGGDAERAASLLQGMGGLMGEW